jgi:hypothetical protein
MKTRILGLAVIASIGLLACGGAQALAATCSGSVTYASAGNGTNEGAQTFPGTNVGTVGCGSSEIGQIGDLNNYNGGANSGGAYVGSGHDPSNYYFYFAGGSLLTITFMEGNNGTNAHIGVNLFSYDNNNNTYDPTPLGSLSGIDNTNTFTVFTLLSNGALTAGYYIINTYLEVAGDPNYQINFYSETPIHDDSATPLPGALPLLASGLGALGLLGWRRKKKTALAS